MINVKNLELTKDPLTNISLMVPMLNERACEVVSYFMYGCCIGESIAMDSQKDKCGKRSLEIDRPVQV